MSIENEINRISTNVSDTLTAIEEMGGEVPEGAGSNEMAAAARTIPVGAKIDDTTPSATTTYSSTKIDALLNEQKEAIDKQGEEIAKIDEEAVILGTLTIKDAEGNILGAYNGDNLEIVLPSMSMTNAAGVSF